MDGGEPPIRRAVRPNRCEGNCATRNLSRGKMREGEVRRGADAREGRELWKIQSE
jgi:hypothetical protein